MYPATVNERAYQVDIIQTALLQNTLVCLPTGLGKTLIAAVIMHNFTRWFPEVMLNFPACPVSWLGVPTDVSLLGTVYFQVPSHDADYLRTL